MQIRTSPLELKLKTPFRIAHGVSTGRTNLLVELGDGRGEAGLPPYLEPTFEEAAAWLATVRLPEWDSEEAPPIESWLADLEPGPAAARCALDLALHDYWGKRIGAPLFRLFGLDPGRSPRSFRTLSIPERLEDLTAESIPPGNRLKLKVGTGDHHQDVAIVRRVRELTDAVLCVDANGAWSIPQAVEALPRIAEFDVAFVEQPIANTDPDDWHLLCRLVGSSNRPPLVADESVRTGDDIIALAGAATGINIKLAKCGGLSASRRLIALGRSLDLDITLGCMVESSLAIAAAAHLAPLADFIDLDGADLLEFDPFEGIGFEDGRPVPTGAPGIGVVPRPKHASPA
jgi:L-Ala-D/L-Glu epimerase / N-acetyl-D-glutamate racemase